MRLSLSKLFKFFLMLWIAVSAAAPAFADRGDRHERRDWQRHHRRDWDHQRRYDRRFPHQSRVIFTPQYRSVFPVFPSPPPFYRAQPNEVSMTCTNGQNVTIRGMGLSVNELMQKANAYCASRTPAWIDAADVQDDYCREYQTTTTVGGMLQSGYGTACLQPDGSWKIVK